MFTNKSVLILFNFILFIMVGSGKIILIQLDPDPQLSLCTVAVDVQYGEELLHFSSVVDPELFIPDPDPGKSFGSMRIRIHNTVFSSIGPLIAHYIYYKNKCTSSNIIHTHTYKSIIYIYIFYFPFFPDCARLTATCCALLLYCYDCRCFVYVSAQNNQSTLCCRLCNSRCWVYTVRRLWSGPPAPPWWGWAASPPRQPP